MAKQYHCSLEQIMNSIKTPADYWIALGNFHKDYTRFCQTEDSVLGKDLVERVKTLVFIGNVPFKTNPIQGTRGIYDAFDRTFDFSAITIDILKRLKRLC